MSLDSRYCEHSLFKKKMSFFKQLTKYRDVTADSDLINCIYHLQIHSKLGLEFRSDFCLFTQTSTSKRKWLMLFCYSTVKRSPEIRTVVWNPPFFPMVLVYAVECSGSGPCRLSPQYNECVHACSFTIIIRSPFTQRDFETQVRGSKKAYLVIG